MERLFLAVAFFVFAGAIVSGLSGCATRAISGKESATNAPAEQRLSGKAAKQIVGIWYKKQTAASRYARHAEQTGDFETLEITDDGRIRREILTVTKIYDCPVADAAVTEGAITIESDTRLTLTFGAGTTRRTENCSPDKNHTTNTKPTTSNYEWRVSKSNDGATELCLTNGDTICYRRAE